MRSYKFKLYESKNNRFLKRSINVSGVIWNHCIALHKRYYRRFKKHLSCSRLQRHILKMRKRIDWWQQVGSQAVQDIVQRIEKAYQAFFRRDAKRPPKFKKVKKYTSFTLKQAGYKFLGSNLLRVTFPDKKRVFKFSKSRDIQGKIKTVTIKRDKVGDLFMTVVTDDSQSYIIDTIETGKTAGFDFGLKTFLTVSTGEKIESPEFFKQSRKDIKRLNRALSRKVKGSNNWNKARIELAKAYRTIANKRRDFFWKLAHQLTDRFDVLCFETLNLKGMAKLWGRKIYDLALGEFLNILKWVAKKKGKLVKHIDRWYPSSKTCSNCLQTIETLELRVRNWVCEPCGTKHDRDHNAAINIHRVGMST